MRINPELLEVAPNNTRIGTTTALGIDPGSWPDTILCRRTIYKRVAIHDQYAVYVYDAYRIRIYNTGKP